jgi:hypothetical protein
MLIELLLAAARRISQAVESISGTEDRQAMAALT